MKTLLKKYDVVYCVYPFEDSANVKIRPGVIMGNNKIAYLVSKITSQHKDYYDYNKTEYELLDWEDEGLSKPSVVRLGKIEEIRPEDIIEKVGHLSERDSEGIMHLIRESLLIKESMRELPSGYEHIFTDGEHRLHRKKPFKTHKGEMIVSSLEDKKKRKPELNVMPDKNPANIPASMNGNAAAGGMGIGESLNEAGLSPSAIKAFLAACEVAKGFKGMCGPFGSKDPEVNQLVNGAEIIFSSQSPDETYSINSDLSVDFQFDRHNVDAYQDYGFDSKDEAIAFWEDNTYWSTIKEWLNDEEHFGWAGGLSQKERDEIVKNVENAVNNSNEVIDFTETKGREELVRSTFGKEISILEREGFEFVPSISCMEFDYNDGTTMLIGFPGKYKNGMHQWRLIYNEHGKAGHWSKEFSSFDKMYDFMSDDEQLESLLNESANDYYSNEESARLTQMGFTLDRSNEDSIDTWVYNFDDGDSIEIYKWVSYTYGVGISDTEAVWEIDYLHDDVVQTTKECNSFEDLIDFINRMSESLKENMRDEPLEDRFKENNTNEDKIIRDLGFVYRGGLNWMYYFKGSLDWLKIIRYSDKSDDWTLYSMTNGDGHGKNFKSFDELINFIKEFSESLTEAKKYIPTKEHPAPELLEMGFREANDGDMYKYDYGDECFINIYPPRKYTKVNGMLDQGWQFVFLNFRAKDGNWQVNRYFDTYEELLEFINNGMEEAMQEAVEKHNELNPDLWEDNQLRPEVKEKILEVVKKFEENLEYDEVELDIDDIVIIGSNASYNYNKDSDIDVHIVADLSEYEDYEDLAMKLYQAYKSLFNAKYDPMIRGHECELYVENGEIHANSNGMYSILSNEWLKEPVKQEIPEVDQSEVDSLVAPFIAKFKEATTIDDIDEIIDDIYVMRQQGILEGGEYDPRNLAFKEFRAKGYLDKLKEKKVKLENDEMSIK